MTIDTLSLDIKADSSAAVRSLNNLTEALRGLRDTAKGQSFKTVSEGVSNLFHPLRAGHPLLRGESPNARHHGVAASSAAAHRGAESLPMDRFHSHGLQP